MSALVSILPLHCANSVTRFGEIDTLLDQPTVPPGLYPRSKDGSEDATVSTETDPGNVRKGEP